MPRKNDVTTVDEIIDRLIELSKEGPISRSSARRALTSQDLLMENSRYNKNRGKKTEVSVVRRPRKKKEDDNT
jgi:hypothetical protein